MSKQIVEDNIWQSRFEASERYYQSWAKRFKCDILEDYYEGHQWKEQGNLAYNPYTLNEIFNIIEIKIGQFVPTFPVFQISPSPGNTDDFDAAVDSAELKQHTLNTIIKNDDIEFISEVELAYKDSFFRFGIIEVGYGSEWILNPNAKKPLLQSSTDAKKFKPGKIVQEPEKLPLNERIFAKHVPAKNFRVGGYDHKYLNRCGWCGYYEFIDKDDLLALPGLMNRDKIEKNDYYSSLYDEPDIERKQTNTPPKNTYKVWKIWDLRSRQQLLILDSPKVTIFQRGFKRLSLFDLRPVRRLVVDGFYPIPQVYHWLSSQDELNETREQLRNHRKRFIRKFQILEGQMDDIEIEKFESGQDGAMVKVKSPDAIKPIDNADLGSTIDKSMLASQDDLNRLSGSSNQIQQVTDRSTATEAQLVNARGAVRENKDRDRFVKWMCRIGREILLTARDKFILGVWVELSSPEGEYTFGEVQDQKPTFKFVSQQDLNDGFDFRINVDLSSLSQSEQEKEKQTFLEFISVLSQFPIISFSPILVREAAYRIGYKNMKVIKEFQTMALKMEQGRQAGLQQGGGNAPQQITQAGTPSGASQASKRTSSALVPNNPLNVQ